MEEKGRNPRTGIVSLERRKHPRFSVDLPIEYYHAVLSNGQAGRLMNASEGGLLIYFPEQMEIGQYVKMKLFFSLGSGLNNVEILAEVVWEDIRLGNDRGDYRYGVRFIDISPDDLNKLNNFLGSLTE